MKPKFLRFLAVGILGAVGVGGLAVADEGLVRTAVRPLETPMFPVTELSSLSGFTSDLTSNPSNACFDGTPDASFRSGETVGLNVFWEDTIEGDLNNQYQVTWAGQLPNGVRKSATFACDYNVTGTGFVPGDLASFCCFLAVPVRPLGQTVSIIWGARTNKLEGGQQQGQLGSFSVGP